MSLSVAPFVIGIVLSQRLRKFATSNNKPEWLKPLIYVISFSVALFAIEAIFQVEYITKWIWHIFLLPFVIILLRQKELRVLRLFILAFVPYLVAALLSDLIQVISKYYFHKWENYIDSAQMLTFIWMAAILFSHNRQSKAAEKERIKREHEDALNKVIAVRKDELEGLVAERTAELLAQKEELEHTLADLRSTQSQLIQSEKMASLGELTAGIAHEIQNPLNFVNNFSELNTELMAELKQEIDKGNFEEVKAIASDIIDNEKKIMHHGKRADGIVKSMLNHSRSSSVEKEPTDINELADEYLRLTYHGIRAKDKSFNATIKTYFDESIGLVNVIPQDIGRVILNLLTNAFFAVKEKKNNLTYPLVEGEPVKERKDDYEPTVSISTRVIGSALAAKLGGNRVEIRVSDNGNGIPHPILKKIFQPFFTTKPTGQGTGLGLSLSYDIITKGHGGELKVETKEGKGSTFIIRLPKA